MIRFLTLFLGLAMGPQPIELAVESPVSRVEIHLDGRQVALIESEPWRATLELGERLEPHVLEAVGLDSKGQEVTRETLLLNYRRPAEEAVLTLAPDGRSGRVLWEAQHGRRPARIQLSLDGEKVDVAAGDGRFALPELDLARVHVLEASLRFPGRSVEGDWSVAPRSSARDAQSRRQFGGIQRQRQTLRVPDSEASAALTFGGERGLVTTSALTPVPIRWAGSRPPSPEEIELRGPGGPLEIQGIDADPPLLLVIQDRNASRRVKGASRRLRDVSPLADGAEVRFASRRPIPGFGGGFLTLPAGRGDVEDGLLAVLQSPDPFPRSREVSRLWDAVAAAGERAARSDRPRAVVLLLGSEGGDESRLRPRQAVEYLASLSVPFLVWAPAVKGQQETSTTVHRADRTVFEGPEGLSALLEVLPAILGRQRIVWVRGRHAPHSIEVVGTTSGHEGVEVVR